MTTIDELEAQVRNIQDAFPRITTELGDRILDCPEGVIEDAREGALPPGFSGRDQVEEFVQLYATLRHTITNAVAREIGEAAVDALLSKIHSD